MPTLFAVAIVVSVVAQAKNTVDSPLKILLLGSLFRVFGLKALLLGKSKGIYLAPQMELNTRSDDHKWFPEVLIRATERSRSENPVVLRGKVSHCPQNFWENCQRESLLCHNSLLSLPVPAFVQILL